MNIPTVPGTKLLLILTETDTELEEILALSGPGLEKILGFCCIWFGIVVHSCCICTVHVYITIWNSETLDCVWLKIFDLYFRYWFIQLLLYCTYSLYPVMIVL